MDLVANDIEARDGTRLRLWELGPEDADEAVLFFHGAITSARGLLAPPTDDGAYSWMHAAAERGQRVFALDLRGYGESDPLPEYDDPPEDSDPVVRAPQAAKDAADALQFVADRVDSVHVTAVSWGTVYTMVMLGGDHPDIDDDVGALADSLVVGAPIYQPSWKFEIMAEGLGIATDLGGYFVMDRENSEDGAAGPQRLFEDVWQIQIDSVQGIDETSYRVPAGAQADNRAASEGNPPHDPSTVSLPTLLMRGEDDVLSERADTLDLYDELGSDGLKEYLEVTDSSHYFVYEPYREVFFDAAYEFQQQVSETED